MKKLIFALFSYVLIFICISCYKDEAPKIESQDKDKHINTNSSFRNYAPPSREDYMELTIAGKKEAWVAKMEYILTTQTLSSSQESLIEQVIDDIEAMEDGEATEDLDDTAEDLLAKFSETDFIATFASLEANTLSGTNTPTCSTCLVTGGAFGASASVIGIACDCNWSCSDPYCASCLETTTGCGFFEMGPCVGQNGPC